MTPFTPSPELVEAAREVICATDPELRCPCACADCTRQARAAIAVIAPALGEEAIRTIDEFNDPEPISNLVAALRAHFGVPAAKSGSGK